MNAIRDIIGERARAETLAAGKVPYGDLLAAQRAIEAHAAVEKVQTLVAGQAAIQTAADAHEAAEKAQALAPTSRLVRHEVETISPAEYRREREARERAEREQAVADALAAFVARADADAQAAKEREARAMRWNVAAVLLAGVSALAAVSSAVAAF